MDMYGSKCHVEEWEETHVPIKTVRTQRREVELSDILTASFHCEAANLSLVSEHCVMLLDREETYRLYALLEAEFKGGAS